MRKIILLSLFAIVLSSCRSQVGVSNGAYSDISLNRDSKEYTITRLKEINSESNAIFGIPTDKSMNKKQGLITSKLEKIKKTFFQLDYKHQDIYINKKMFEKLIKSSTELDNDNLNPLISDKLVKIQHNNPKEEVNCL